MTKNILLTASFLLFTLAGNAQFVVEKKDNTYANVPGKISFTPKDDNGWDLNGTDISEVMSIERRLDLNLTDVALASYRTGSNSTSSDKSADYYFCISDVPTTRHEDGTIEPTEPGVLMMFELYGALSSDPDAAVLPEGTYTVGGDKTAGTADIDFTFARVKNEDGSVSYKTLSGGSITVAHTADGGYDIKGDFTTVTGENFTTHYSGKLQFDNDSQSADESLMTENVDNAQFKELTITAHGGDSDYHRFSLQLFDGDAPDGVISNGVVLHVDLFAPAPENDEIYIADGDYNASADYEEITQFEPFTFLPGNVYSVLGYPLYIGTYMQDLRKSEETGHILYGYVNGGTITVKRNGDSYTVTVSLTTRNGKTITGSYTGTPTIIDSRPVEPEGPWSSTLREDKEMVFSNDTYSYAHCYENYPAEGVNEFEVIVNDHITRESFQLDLVVPAGVKSPEGTYSVSDYDKSGSYKAYTFIPGYYNMAVMGGTWAWELFGENSSYPVQQAPATDGTIEIKKNDDGTFSINYNLLDDAEPKHTIKASWTGVINDPRHSWTE